jgi:uncharacterized membrane protein YfcA
VPDIAELLILLLVGCAGGLLSGLLGVGGGVVFIPILDYYLSRTGISGEESVKFILANSLFAIIFSGVVGSMKQYRLGNFYPRAIIYTALPGVVSSLATTWLISLSPWYSKEMFTILFVSLLVILMVRMFMEKKSQTTVDPELVKLHRYSIVGFLTGIVTSLSGLGGGVIMVPVFSNLLKLDIKKATSISTGVIPIFALPITVFYMISQPVSDSGIPYHIGYIILPLIVPIITGVLIFAGPGVRLAQKLPSSTIKIIFAVFISIVLIKMITQLYSNF